MRPRAQAQVLLLLPQEAVVASGVGIMVYRTTEPLPATNVVVQTIMLVIVRRKL